MKKLALLPQQPEQLTASDAILQGAAGQRDVVERGKVRWGYPEGRV